MTKETKAKRNAKKSILFVADMLGYGGMSTLISESGKYLEGRGYSMTLLTVTTHPQNVAFKNRFKSFSTIYYTQIPSYEGIGNKTRIVLQTLRLFIKVLEHEKIDILWCTVPFCAIGVLMHPQAWKLPRIFFFLSPLELELKTNYFEGSPDSALLKKMKTWIYFFITKMSLELFPSILTCSQYARSLLIDHYKITPQKVKIAPGFISWKKMEVATEEERRRLRKSLGLDPDTFLFFFPSRFEPGKNPELIVKALESLNNELIVVAFSGTYLNPNHYRKWYKWAMRKNIRKNIIFLPYVSRSKLRKVYRAADCVLFSSLDLETFGFVALEAFTQGVPVIGSNAGAISEMLSKADPNLIVKSQGLNHWKQKIKWFMNLKPAERNALAKKCLTVADQYNSDKNKDILHQAIRDTYRDQSGNSL